MDRVCIIPSLTKKWFSAKMKSVLETNENRKIATGTQVMSSKR